MVEETGVLSSFSFNMLRQQEVSFASSSTQHYEPQRVEAFINNVRELHSWRRHWAIIVIFSDNGSKKLRGLFFLSRWTLSDINKNICLFQPQKIVSLLTTVHSSLTLARYLPVALKPSRIVWNWNMFIYITMQQQTSIIL